jgi:hypothetical protein
MRKQHRRLGNTFRSDPAWWAWIVVALMALLPLTTALASRIA